VAAAAAFGLLVAARAAFGPLSFPVPIRTPINIESFFGLLLTLTLVLRSGSGVSKPQPVRAAWAALLAALVAAAFWRASDIYFLADDFFHVVRANTFEWPRLRPYWTTPEGNAFFRPLGHFFLAGMANWSHYDPRWWHWDILTFHAANAILVSVLAARLGLGRIAALFAGALFAVHGATPESAVWITGWFGVLPAFFTLLGLLAFLKYFENSWWGVACLACMILAFVSKESAYAFPLIALLLVVARRIPLKRAAWILGALFAMAFVIFAYRWHVLGGIGGYIDPQSGGLLFLELGLVQVLRSLLLRVWAVLYFPINWSVQPEWWLGMLVLFYIGALLWIAARGGTKLPGLFPAGFVLLASLPPLEQLLIGPDLEKSRALYLPLIGFCLLLAAAIDSLEGRARWFAPAAITLFHVAALQHNISIWRQAGELAHQTCLSASRCVEPASTVRVRDLPGTVNGVYFLGAGFGECIGMQTGSPPLDVQRAADPTAQVDLFWDAAASALRCAK